MKEIIILRDCRGYKEGQVMKVNPNEAHSLIDCGCAMLYELYKKADYEDKMMRPRRKYGHR